MTGVPAARGLVFGASSGVGAAVATLMAEQGCHVLAASRRGSAPPGAGITTLRCDVRDPASVDRAFRAAGDHGGLDWVVNAAGVGYFAPVEEEFAQQWQDILHTNATSSPTPQTGGYRSWTASSHCPRPTSPGPSTTR